MNIVRMPIRFLAFYIFCIAISIGAQPIRVTPLLQVLLDDIKLYTFDSEGDPYLHAGDLYQHSIWTYNGMVELLQGDLPYVQDLQLTPREKEVVALAALLHDIGKAGRKELFERTHPRLQYVMVHNEEYGYVENVIYYQDRQEHPRISFEYVAKTLVSSASPITRDYYCVHRQTGALVLLDIAQMFAELGVTVDEQRIIAILLGIHYEFGNFKHGKITADQFLDLLQDLISAVEYNDGSMDEKIVRLAILIQAADVKGLTPVPAQATALFPDGIGCNPVHQPTKFTNAFEALGYVSHDSCCSSVPLGVQAMDNLIECFHARHEQANELELPVPA